LIAGAAQRLGVAERALRAVLLVECGTDDPDRFVAPDGSAILRVEAHHVLRRPELAKIDPILRVGSWYGPPAREPPRPWEGHEVLFDGRWSDYHRQDRVNGLPCEWDALDAATTLVGAEAAAACASWGPGQVLGAHATALGYASAQTLASAAGTPEGGLEVVCAFLRSRPTLVAALQRLDWFAFAREYNGPGKAADYADKLRAAWNRRA
jgi:hypothetical protein